MEKTITIDKKYNVWELYKFARSEQLKKIYPKLNTRRSFEVVTSRIRKEAKRQGLIDHEFTKNGLVLIIKGLDIKESTRGLYINRLSVLLNAYNTGKSIYTKRRRTTRIGSERQSVGEDYETAKWCKVVWYVILAIVVTLALVLLHFNH